jgi:hypothetical protein
MGKTVYVKVEDMKLALQGLVLTKDELIQQIYKRIGSDSRTVKRVLEVLEKFQFLEEKNDKFKFK